MTRSGRSGVVACYFKSNIRLGDQFLFFFLVVSGSDGGVCRSGDNRSDREFLSVLVAWAKCYMYFYRMRYRY
ncbi:hypothetical protein B0T13DRAFT_470513 [Neurospora crassa]|nr:hypothetical protein B0T13DRAFT_470513 [Neurospora crassa]